MPKPHRLYREKENVIPSHIIFVDTETRMKPIPGGGADHVFRLGWCCYYSPAREGRKEACHWQRLASPDEFWRFVADHTWQKTKLYIIGHNIGFDFLILHGPDSLSDYGYERRMFYDEGLTTIIKYKKPGHQIYLISSTNHFPFALKKLGDNVNLPKLSIDFDDTDYESLSVYCRRDVEILVETYKRYFAWLAENDFGSFRMTKASQAFSVFRRRFMRHDIYIHGNTDLAMEEKMAYYGGRCEAFFIGTMPVRKYYLYDVNSLYPSVMVNNWFPTKFRKVLKNPDLVWLHKILKKYCVLADCQIKTDTPQYPFKDKKLIFPVGTFRTTLNSPEILRAYAQGHLLHVHKAWVYERGKIFREYVKALYRLKDEYDRSGNKQYRLLTKDLLNSLYGKFGQFNEVWEIVDTCCQQSYETIWYYDETLNKFWKERKLLGIVERQSDKVPSINTLVPIASHVTAYARCYLWDLFQAAGRENVFYCDTDSLLVNNRGRAGLRDYIDPHILGKVSLQGTFNHVTIHGPKDYIFDDKIVHKGVPGSAVQTSENTWLCQQWPGIKTAIAENQPGHYRTKEVKKTLKRCYDKGVVSVSGQVLPLLFDSNS